MVKVFLNNRLKSFNLEHFRAVKLKVFFNGGSIPFRAVSASMGGGGVLFDKFS